MKLIAWEGKAGLGGNPVCACQSGEPRPALPGPRQRTKPQAAPTGRGPGRDLPAPAGPHRFLPLNGPSGALGAIRGRQTQVPSKDSMGAPRAQTCTPWPRASEDKDASARCGGWGTGGACLPATRLPATPLLDHLPGHHLPSLPGRRCCAWVNALRGHLCPGPHGLRGGDTLAPLLSQTTRKSDLLQPRSTAAPRAAQRPRTGILGNPSPCTGWSCISIGGPPAWGRPDCRLATASRKKFCRDAGPRC